MECLFCKIVEGKIPSHKVYEDNLVLGFKDITPQAPIHYLFIPKLHIEGLDDVPEATTILADIFRAIQKTARQEGFAEKGYRTSINTNKEGGQVVYHLHVHCLAGKQMGGNLVGY